MRIHTFIVLGLTACIALFLLTTDASGDDHDHDDDHDDDRKHEREHGGERARGRASTRDGTALRASPEYQAYAQECGSCHLAYPPGFLPARSWQKLMGGLAGHFGDTAELDADTTQQLTSWLTANAAESGSHRRSAKILRSVRGATPLRPSQTPYILSKHDDIDAGVFRRKSITSRANCGACHRGAERWAFDDDDVKIPRQ